MSSKIKVLVVEDESLIRMDLVDFLSEEGFDVFEAADADAAIAILEANDAIQVMFTDVDMPGSMDGLKLSAAVRDRWPPVRIVVTSGHRAVELTDLPEGSLFYAKPYDHAAIAQSLRGLLSL
ncbi:MAG: response regulator [Mesorhizobium sp.]|nr:response regulator [Mesorhizobium sp.]